MVEKSKALPGRQTKMKVAKTHYVFKDNSMEGPFPANMKMAILANGW